MKAPAPAGKKRILPLRKGEYSTPTVWEPTGRSPGNTPQAQLQAAQMLMPFVMNPPLAVAVGVDTYEILKVLINAGPLANAKNILIPKDQLNAQAQMPPAGMVPPVQPGQPPQVPGQPGGPPPAQLPPSGPPNPSGPL